MAHGEQGERKEGRKQLTRLLHTALRSNGSSVEKGWKQQHPLMNTLRLGFLSRSPGGLLREDLRAEPKTRELTPKRKTAVRELVNWLVIRRRREHGRGYFLASGPDGPHDFVPTAVFRPFSSAPVIPLGAATVIYGRREMFSRGGRQTARAKQREQQRRVIIVSCSLASRRVTETEVIPTFPINSNDNNYLPPPLPSLPWRSFSIPPARAPGACCAAELLIPLFAPSRSQAPLALKTNPTPPRLHNEFSVSIF